jgi:hypothetical protein
VHNETGKVLCHLPAGTGFQKRLGLFYPMNTVKTGTKLIARVKIPTFVFISENQCKM